MNILFNNYCKDVSCHQSEYALMTYLYIYGIFPASVSYAGDVGALQIVFASAEEDECLMDGGNGELWLDGCNCSGKAVVVGQTYETVCVGWT